MPSPICICVDVEPDLPVFDPARSAGWDGFDRMEGLAPALRQRLEDETGSPAAFTWFLRMDEQIARTWGTPAWAAEQRGQPLQRLTDAGDELGVHTHCWRWSENGREWVADFADEAWGVHCLELGLQAFEDAFGRPSRAHRGGNGHLSGAMFERLGAAGVRVDMTPEPGVPPPDPANTNEPIRGLPANDRRISPHPYRSNPSRYPLPDPTSELDPLLVPMFSAPAARPPFRRAPIWPLQRSWIFRSRLRLGLLWRSSPIISMAIRSSSSLGPEWETIEQNLLRLARLPGSTFVTASRALDLIEADA